jgi:translation initiation factor IF-3
MRNYAQDAFRTNKSNDPRLNGQIRAQQVRLIDADGSQLGIKSIQEAITIAQDRGMDLVEVAPEANPPVCKVIDFSKYRYEKEKQRKEARKHQKGGHVKEIRFRLKISEHDFDTKLRSILKFVKQRDKVRITVMFQGREMEHQEIGHGLINRIIEYAGNDSVVEANPQFMGNRLILMLAPKKA